MYEEFLELPEMCLNESGTCLDVSGRCLEHLYTMCGPNPEPVWTVTGACLDGVHI